MRAKPILYLAGALACVVLILMLSGGDGLRAETRALLEAETEAYPSAERQVAEQRKAIDAALEAEGALFRLEERKWSQRLEIAAARLDEARRELDTATALTEQRDDQLRPKIETALLGAREARSFALAETAAVHASVQRLLALKKDRAKTVADAAADAEAIERLDLQRSASEVRRAVLDWPAKEADLGRRLAAMTELRGQAAAAWGTVRSENAQGDDQIDLPALAEACDLLHRSLIDLSKANGHLLALSAQLYQSWDKILVDMAIEEGEEVSFHHKYRLVKLPFGEPEGAKPEQSESWEAVSKTVYEGLKENLGMTVATKPAGAYDSEAQTTAPQPAGFAYVASPEEGQNAYGRWRHDSHGNSFWEFYGKYALMRSLFWGPTYTPIYSGDYRGYRSARAAGRSYYGSDRSGAKRYGSGAQRTRTQYASSRYVGSDGFKGSRYEQSGGKYRGSKFEPKSSRTRSASTSSSRSRSYRSSSRSRGGK